MTQAAIADKRRHPRRKVLIPARLKHDSGWSDIVIRDISAKGMLIQGALPPPRGSYVEVRRGSLAIAARIAWVNNQQFGVTTQDGINIEAFIHQAKASQFGQGVGPASGATVERRVTPRPVSSEQVAARNRQVSALIQYGFIGVLAIAFAIMIAGFIKDTVGRTLGTVGESLEGDNQ